MDESRPQALLGYCLKRSQVSLKKNKGFLWVVLLVCLVFCLGVLYYWVKPSPMKTISKGELWSSSLSPQFADTKLWLKSQQLEPDLLNYPVEEREPAHLLESIEKIDPLVLEDMNQERLKRQTLPTLVYTRSLNTLPDTQSEKENRLVSCLKDLSYTLLQGELLQATLETAIHSELSGQLRAILTYPVFGFDGKKILFPAGSRLIGQYQSLLFNGSASTRIFVAWDRLVTPNGLSIQLKSPASDALGRAGLDADCIDRHHEIAIKSSILSSVLSWNKQKNEWTDEQSHDALLALDTEPFKDSLKASDQKKSKVQSTLQVYSGHHVSVFVAHDIDLSTYRHEID